MTAEEKESLEVHEAELDSKVTKLHYLGKIFYTY